jgi:hypothetical protein
MARRYRFPWEDFTPDLRLSNIPRPPGLESHVANVKRRNIVMDAATIIARHRGFLTPDTEVALSPAENQEFTATGGLDAAHAVKRFTFREKNIGEKMKSIFEVYNRPGVEKEAIVHLGWMLGSVTDVHRRANRSIDRRLEENPERLKQLKLVVGSSIGSLAEARALALELESQRRFFDKVRLSSMRGGFEGDANYEAMLSLYEAILPAPPSFFDGTPDGMVNMVATMFEG